MAARASGLRPIRATRHPSRARAIAVARPTPDPAPVMTANRVGVVVGELMCVGRKMEPCEGFSNPRKKRVAAKMTRWGDPSPGRCWRRLAIWEAREVREAWLAMRRAQEGV